MTETMTPLAHRIARHIHAAGMETGAALTERGLAEQFDLSRSPIRAALADLAQKGIVSPAARGGYLLADPGAAQAMAQAEPPPDAAEAIYLAIARDRLAGRLEERISENELTRRYGLTRLRLHALLRRMTEEGWAERLPGHGWRFLPVLTSMESYRQSYSFRHAIEPAALREPGFHADPALLERLLDEQLRLVAGEFHTLSPVRLFDLNSAMHESLVECSGNSFFIDSLRRVNRLRRLIEYDLPLDREKARLRCEEHVEILELVQNGHNEMAAIAMEMHLEKLGPIKARR